MSKEEKINITHVNILQRKMRYFGLFIDITMVYRWQISKKLLFISLISLKLRGDIRNDEEDRRWGKERFYVWKDTWLKRMLPLVTVKRTFLRYVGLGKQRQWPQCLIWGKCRFESNIFNFDDKCSEEECQIQKDRCGRAAENQKHFF